MIRARGDAAATGVAPPCHETQAENDSGTSDPATLRGETEAVGLLRSGGVMLVIGLATLPIRGRELLLDSLG